MGYEIILEFELLKWEQCSSAMLFDCQNLITR